MWSDERCCQFPLHVYTPVIFKFTNNERGLYGEKKKKHFEKLYSILSSREIITFGNIYGNELVVMYNSVSFSF